MMASMKSTATAAVENIVAEVAEDVVASEVTDNIEDVVVVVVALPVLQEAILPRFASRKPLYDITVCNFLNASAHTACNNLILSFNLFLAAWHYTKAKWVCFFAFNICNFENNTDKHLHGSVMFLILAGYSLGVSYDMGERLIFHGIHTKPHFCILVTNYSPLRALCRICSHIPPYMEKFGWSLVF